MTYLHEWLDYFLADPRYIVYADLALAVLFLVAAQTRLVWLVFKSLRRNLLRTILTAAAIVVLVFVVTLVWTVLWFLDLVMTEKAANFKAIATEKWQIPSQMPFAYAEGLSAGAASKPTDAHPLDSMTWGFYGATLEPDKRSFESILFFFVMEPRKLLTMMDDLDRLPPDQKADLERAVKAMEQNKRAIIVGHERLERMGKKVGERISMYGVNYKDINLDDCEIVGTFPDGGYNMIAILNRDRLRDALDAYKIANGKAHPMADKTLNLVWLRVSNKPEFNQIAQQIEASPLYQAPAVKVETASSGVAAFLDPYRDLLWGMRWVLVPAILVVMALVIANAIGISVRERRTEMAVLKVLGYSPAQILGLVLGEALLIGSLSGLLSSGLTYVFINHVVGGVKFPIAFFPAFLIPTEALGWGPMLGGVTAFCGSILPAWSACRVKVAEVFSKIA
jgi:putative ABC transport system permease protein